MGDLRLGLGVPRASREQAQSRQRDQVGLAGREARTHTVVFFLPFWYWTETGGNLSFPTTISGYDFIGKTLALVSIETSRSQESKEILRFGFVFTERPENLWSTN